MEIGTSDKDKEVKLYHGTSEESAEAIEQEGFLGSELSEFTTEGAGAGDVVFFSDSIEYAAEYGEAIIEAGGIPEGKIHYFGEGPWGGNEYFIHISDLIEFGWWQRI